jgi:phage terminase large subunit
MVSIEVDLSVFNRAHRPYLLTSHRREVFYGGAGSGKSFFIAQRLVYRHLKDKGKNTLVLRKVAQTSRHSTFALICQIINLWGVSHLFKIRKSDMTITNAINGNQIKFAGLDDPEKLKSITFESGILTDVWIEEATEITKADYLLINTRLRGKIENQNVKKNITLSFNPIDARLWLKDYFFDHKQPDTMILHTTALDNDFLEEEDKEELRRLKDIDRTFYNVYWKGEWGTPENTIYSNWRVVDRLPRYTFDFYYGLDFGFNNPSALVRVGNMDQELYVSELLYKSKLTTPELIDSLKELIPYEGAPIFADSARPDLIEEISQAGFNIYPADKDVIGGITFLKAKKLNITKESVNLIKELQGYKWKEDREGNVLDQPVKFMDHLVDAMRYAIYSNREEEGESPTIMEAIGKYKNIPSL